MMKAQGGDSRRAVPSSPGGWGRGAGAAALSTTICAFGAALGVAACAAAEIATSPGPAAQQSRERATGDDVPAAPGTRREGLADDSEAAAGEAENASDDGVVYLSGRRRRDLESPSTLVAAAADARAQRAAAGPPVATITDENRERRAARGSLTYVNEGPDTPSEATSAADSDAGAETRRESVVEPTESVTGEAYWRRTVRDARLRWRDSARRIELLRGRVTGLRNAYYATDDPHYREGVLKRDWDAATGDLATAEAEVAAAREDLRRKLNAGRRAGALPGWLREGLELEPDPPGARDTEPSIVEPIEPPMAQEQPRP